MKKMLRLFIRNDSLGEGSYEEENNYNHAGADDRRIFYRSLREEVI